MNHYRKVILLWIVMVVGVTSTVLAKAPEIEWARIIGGEDREGGKCIQKTYDGNYIIVGTKNGIKYGIGKYEKGSYCYVYLVKINEKGKVLWERTYGDTNFFYSGAFVQQTADSGFIISGRRSGTRSENGILLLKTDNAGKNEWMKTYGKGKGGSGSEVYQTADSCYIVFGGIGSWPQGDIFIMKVNSDGDSLWARRYGYKPVGDVAYSGQLKKEGGFIVTGYTESFGSPEPYALGRFYLMSINSMGDSLWTKIFSTGKELENGVGSCMRKTSDGGYIITGEIRGNFLEKRADVFLHKTDSLCNLIWAREYGGKHYDKGNDVLQTSDGGYIVVGYTQKTSGRDSTWIYIVRTDENGALLWTRTDKNPYKSEAHSVIQTNDGGFLIVGGMGGDVYLIKLKPEE